VEGLETRQLLSTFSVVLATDSGGSSSGQGVTATSGDLRWCINQADHQPTGTADTITFDPTLFATPQTITLDTAKGTLVLSDSNPLTIQGPSGSTATVSGGDAVAVLDIASGTVTINNLAISHGHTSGYGGGINNNGTLIMANCIFDHDVALEGGGLENLAIAKLTGCNFFLDTADKGGGILTKGQKKLTLTNCNLSNDSASGIGGGALWINAGCTATVMGTTFDNDSAPGGDGGAVFIVGPTSLGTLTNCTFTNDSAGTGGGGVCTDGVCTVKMTQCTISNDTAPSGGGVSNAGGTVVLTQCTLSNDSSPATGNGGGLSNGGTATVTACTFNNDSAYAGGGLFNRGPGTLVNCTFAYNTATATGGAIDNAALGNVFSTLNVTNCTIAVNSANHGSGGGIVNDPGNTLNLYNTLVAENIASSSGPDISGTINIADHNLIGDGGGSTIVTDQGGNLIGGNGNPVIDPRLGPLANHGGFTKTMALLADSPAIGNADNPKAPSTDQRGHKRVDLSGEVTDIGAFEYP
jgi:predicted outer membrane repeat protein